MLEDLLSFDQELLIFLNQLGCRAFDNIWLFISHKYTWIPLYAFLLYLMFKNFGKRYFWMVLALVGIVFFFTDFMVSQVYRPFFHRLRPCHVPELAEQLRLVKPSCGGKYGFFSAHASNTMGLAVFLGNVFFNKYPHLWKYLLIWALVVGYSRIYLGVHYPLDIICGTLYGATVATLVFALFKKLRIPMLSN